MTAIREQPREVRGGAQLSAGTQAGTTGLLAAVVTTLIMLQAVVLVVAELRARRRGRPSVLGPA